MIRVVLSGGIGNQLFQYAAGRALAIARDTELLVDRPTAKLTTVRRERVVPSLQTAAKETTLLTSIYRKWAIKHRYTQLLGGRVFYEAGYDFFEDFFELPDETTLFGFFQNERYFKPFSDRIRTELSFRAYPLTAETKQLMVQIAKENAVSVHIRRGDYLTIEKFNVCTKAYYEKAIELLRSKLKDPRFYFFSDDIDWCDRHFQASDFVICDLPESKHHSIHDLKAMSLCKHHIIANSSFSWWGAWLNGNPNKIVAAPYKWFNAEDDPVDSILCDEWIKIDF